MTRTRTTLLVAIMVGAGIGGCDAAADPGPAPSASSNRQQLLALGQEWVQCMRDHGLTRMPDAQVNQDGYLQFPPQDGYQWKEELRNHPGIIEACKSIEDRYPPNAFRPRQQFSAADLPKLAEFAKCMRANGVADFPDPNAKGEFDFGDDQPPPGPVMDQAEQACKSVWSGEVRINGTGGGKK